MISIEKSVVVMESEKKGGLDVFLQGGHGEVVRGRFSLALVQEELSEFELRRYAAGVCLCRHFFDAYVLALWQRLSATRAVLTQTVSAHAESATDNVGPFLATRRQRFVAYRASAQSSRKLFRRQGFVLHGHCLPTTLLVSFFRSVLAASSTAAAAASMPHLADPAGRHALCLYRA